MNVKFIVKRLKLYKKLLLLFSLFVLYVYFFGNIFLRIIIYLLMNCFVFFFCKMVLCSFKCIYGKLYKWFKGYCICINIKVINKIK